MVDLSTSQVWSDVAAPIGTTNDWDGKGNTSKIIGQSGHSSSAAKLCDDYTNDDYGTGVYKDWYLPSVAELNHVWNNLYEVQKALTNDGNDLTTLLTRTAYWSSMEKSPKQAWYFCFGKGHIDDRNSEKDKLRYVRALRAF